MSHFPSAMPMPTPQNAAWMLQTYVCMYVCMYVYECICLFVCMLYTYVCMSNFHITGCRYWVPLIGAWVLLTHMSVCVCLCLCVCNKHMELSDRKTDSIAHTYIYIHTRHITINSWHTTPQTAVISLRIRIYTYTQGTYLYAWHTTPQTAVTSPQRAVPPV
jgi:hypothetical protein